MSSEDASGQGFDFSPWSNLLNDPSLMQLAQQLQADPAFKQMQQVLQESFGMAPPLGQDTEAGDTSTAAAEASEKAPAEAPNSGSTDPKDPPQFPMPMLPGMDPNKALEAIQQLHTSPQFIQMAEKIQQTLLQHNPVMKAMMDPAQKDAMQAKFEELKEDPELAPIMRELESGNPEAMMKHWNNPEVLKKFNTAMQDVMKKLDDDQEQGAEDVEKPTMQSLAGDGDVEGLKKLLESGTDIDDCDEEGRTGLHFASGYGEMDCMKFFLDNGAKVDNVDNNCNTALHYAAGYGQADAVKLLIERGASKDKKNEDENTPKQVAELNKMKEIVDILEGKEAPTQPTSKPPKS